MKHQLRRLFVALAAVIVTLASNVFPATPSAAAFNRWPPYPSPYGSYYGCMHVVHYGETMSGIASLYGTSMYGMMQANGIQNPNYMYPGMGVHVPCSYPYPVHYPVHYPAQCYPTHYMVYPGDNLYSIGLRYGMSYYTLAYYNGLRDPNLIYAGMWLVIPCSMGYPSHPYPPQPYPAPGYPPQPYPAPGYPPQPYPTPVYPPQPYPTPGYPTPTPMSTPPSTGQVMVVMRNIAFNPSTVTIRVGQTVVWRNDDTAPHTTTSGSCPGGVCAPMPGWDSGTLNPGQSYSHTFTTTGTFSYYCRIHGAMMQGTITVMP